MRIIYVIMVSETGHNGEFVEIQSWRISQNPQAYTPTYKYKEEGEYNIAIYLWKRVL